MARGIPEADTLLDGWIEQQRDLLNLTLGGWLQQQQALTQAWFDWLDGLSGGTAGRWDAAWSRFAWPALPEELVMAGPRLMQAWWAPWAPFVERGGEQLG